MEGRAVAEGRLLRREGLPREARGQREAVDPEGRQAIRGQVSSPASNIASQFMPAPQVLHTCGLQAARLDGVGRHQRTWGPHLAALPPEGQGG